MSTQEDWFNQMDDDRAFDYCMTHHFEPKFNCNICEARTEARKCAECRALFENGRWWDETVSCAHKIVIDDFGTVKTWSIREILV